MGHLIETRKHLKDETSTLRQAVWTLEEEWKGAERALATAKKCGYKTVSQHQQTVERLIAALNEAKANLDAKTRELRQIEKQLHTIRQQRGAARVEAARVELGLPDHLLLTAAWADSNPCGHWTVAEIERDWEGNLRYEEWTAEEWTDEDGTVYPRETQRALKRRFGYDATVYGPRQGYGGGGAEWIPAQVNWGSIGVMTVTQALAMMKVHEMAIELAALLNRRRDAWTAEDTAD